MMKQLSEKSKEPDPQAEFQLPGRREFQVLRLLWDAPPLTVQDVRDRLPAQTSLAYTTVMTILDQLHRKGLVHRRRVGRAYRYRPAQEPETVCRSLVAGFVADFFDSDWQQVRTLLAELDGRRTVRPTPPAVTPEPEESDTAWGEEDVFLL